MGCDALAADPTVVVALKQGRCLLPVVVLYTVATISVREKAKQGRVGSIGAVCILRGK